MNHVLVRQEFSEQAIWRVSLGDAEPLLVFATFGDISAPEHPPAGSMWRSNMGKCYESRCSRLYP